MLENLLFQDEAAGLLRSGFRDGTLPRSLLFHGPLASGKTTAALELARALSCREKAEWNCPCPSCERHRRLAHPDLLIAGPDAFMEEISAAMESLSRAQGRRELYAFLRSVRRLARRFDRELWEGEESKYSKAVPPLTAMDELLPSIDPETAGAGKGGAAILDVAQRILQESAKLSALVPPGVPVSQVRAAIRWARLTPNSLSKVLVIENAETMLESSRNAFLKLLEEPPRTAYIVLTTSRKSSLMETILSRLRPVAFAERGKEATEEILKRVFGLAEPLHASMAAFMDGFSRPTEPELAAAAAALVKPRFARASRAMGLEPGDTGDDPEGGAPEALLDRTAFPRLCKAMLAQLGLLLRSSPPDPRLASLAEAWGRAIREAASAATILNQSPPSLLRRALLAMEYRP
jgi:DNA polymerase-3 subunit gamma/tau